MNIKRQKQRGKKDSKPLFGLFLLASILIHIGSLFELSHLSLKNQQKEDAKDTTIHVKIVTAPTEKTQKKEEDPTQILEAPQVKTQAPETADYAGQTDHETQQQTRVSNKTPREKQADPSTKKTAQKGKGAKAASSSDATPPTPRVAIESPPTPRKEGQGRTQQVDNAVTHSQPRLPVQGPHAYDQLLATAHDNMESQVEAGYQDYIDNNIKEADSIDINTKEYRYIGYFTNMRKAIELAWNYPMEAAQNGVDGQVHLRFLIEENGTVSKISVLDSSGHLVLDSAIVEAIKVAAPFAPLPPGLKRKNLEVTGTFHYVLN